MKLSSTTDSMDPYSPGVRTPRSFGFLGSGGRLLEASRDSAVELRKLLAGLASIRSSGAAKVGRTEISTGRWQMQGSGAARKNGLGLGAVARWMGKAGAVAGARAGAHCKEKGAVES